MRLAAALIGAVSEGDRVSVSQSVNQHEGAASNSGYRSHRMPFSAIDAELDSLRAGGLGRCILETAS